MTPSGIEPTTFRIVAQFLNQLRHRVPQEELHTFLILALGAHEWLASWSDPFITGEKIALVIGQGDGWGPVPIWGL
jgi:hypothetical protein